MMVTTVKPTRGLRIAVDARNAYRPDRRGIGKMLVHLYQSLALLRPSWQFLMCYQVPQKDDPFLGLPNIQSRCIDCPGDRWNLWRDLRFPAEAWRFRADVLHAPANESPRWSPCPVVLTILDAIPLDDPNPSVAAAFARTVRRGARRADRIVTISEFSRTQLVSRLRADDRKMTVIPLATRYGDAPNADPASFGELPAYASTPTLPFVLVFGAADPRKNSERILRAWASLPRELLKAHQLIMIGVQEPMRGFLAGLATSLGLLVNPDLVAATDRPEGVVRILGYALEEHLPALTARAVFLCYASLSEGFGLPVLDAFALGTPVLASHLPSLVELADECALFVDPTDTESLSKGMMTLLSDPQLCAELGRKGRDRAQRYSWTLTAQGHARVFEHYLPRKTDNG